MDLLAFACLLFFPLKIVMAFNCQFLHQEMEPCLAYFKFDREEISAWVICKRVARTAAYLKKTPLQVFSWFTNAFLRIF